MNQAYGLYRYCLLLLLSAMLCSCATKSADVLRQYDFGPPLSSADAPSHDSGTFRLADILATPALDSTSMLYRLAYDNAQQLKPFAQARWSATPAQLLEQSIKMQFSRAGMPLADSREAAADMFMLRLELDEFSQIFDSPDSSHAQLNVRASLSKGRSIMAQRSFSQSMTAVSNDAAGGARAMQQASDALIAELLHWINVTAGKRQ